MAFDPIFTKVSGERVGWKSGRRKLPEGKIEPSGFVFPEEETKILKQGFLGRGYPPCSVWKKMEIGQKYYEIDVFQFYSSWGLGFL